MKIVAAMAAIAVGAVMVAMPAGGAFAQQAPAAMTASPDASAPKATKSKSTKKKSTAKSSAGRQAATERQRACGAEWKADKAAGKVAAGMTWPKYWSACNTRKKAAGT